MITNHGGTETAERPAI